jgi:hypothetical protein
VRRPRPARVLYPPRPLLAAVATTEPVLGAGRELWSGRS